jgi:three-Cys-motif partner protein
MMNTFGSNWTYQKIKIVELYAKAYLEIMKKHPYWKLMYFDGFAGSGEIELEGKMDKSTIDGAAKRIISIDEPRIFDMYYFVELDKRKAEKLKAGLDELKRSGVFVVSEDCNIKLAELAKFLKGEVGKDGKGYRVLAFIDPFGMNLNFSSIEQLKGLGVDMWVLVPTGIGANRLLKKDGIIPESWQIKLEEFFGIDRDILLKNFYRVTEVVDLFGNKSQIIQKDERAIRRIKDLYIARMSQVFKYVSDSYEMRNSTNSIMFHFFMASNNETAIKIANDIIKKSNRETYGTI